MQQKPLKERLKKDFIRHWPLYLVFLPILAYIILFAYVPMFGVIMAFQNYRPRLGYFKSEFIGFTNFKRFFSTPMFWPMVRNTIVLNLLEIVLGFPAPIIFAILLYEARGKIFKKAVQSISIAPHFISLVVLCGMLCLFARPGGWLNSLISFFTGKPERYLLETESYYYWIFVLSGIWSGFGFSSIVYYAALCGVDRQLFDAAKLDGAGRLRQIWSITIPSILPTITIMLILRMGHIFSVGASKTILLQTNMNYNTSEVLSSYVYSKGLLANDYGYGMAASLFSALVNITFLWVTNKISRRTETSLW